MYLQTEISRSISEIFEIAETTINLKKNEFMTTFFFLWMSFLFVLSNVISYLLENVSKHHNPHIASPCAQ